MQHTTDTKYQVGLPCWIADLSTANDHAIAIAQKHNGERFPFVFRKLWNEQIIETNWLQMSRDGQYKYAYSLVTSLGVHLKEPELTSSLKAYFNTSCSNNAMKLGEKLIETLEREQVELNKQRVAELQEVVRKRLEELNSEERAETFRSARSMPQLTLLVQKTFAEVRQWTETFCSESVDWRRAQQLQAAARFDDEEVNKPTKGGFLQIRLDFLRSQSVLLTRLLLRLLRSVPQTASLQVAELLRKVTCASFLIVLQPNQVLCKRKRFGVSAELLNVNELAQCLNFNDCPVKVCMVNEKGLDPTRTRDPRNLAELVGRAETIRPLNKLEFDKLQWTAVHREETGEVAKQKYFLLLESTLTVDKKFQIDIRATSLPIVLTTHSTIQGKRAAATIFWHNAFADPLNPAQCITEISYPSWAVLKALQYWIGYSTGRLPHDNDLKIVRKWIKVVTNSETDSAVKRDPSAPDGISYSLLTSLGVCKGHDGSTFTLWDWLYGVKRLILSDSFLKKLWQNDYVYGFITLRDAQELLLQHGKACTMLLRFSSSQPGAVTLMGYFGDGKEPESVLGWNAEDLEDISLESRMADLAPEYIMTRKGKPTEWRHLLGTEAGCGGANDDGKYKRCETKAIRIIGSDAWTKDSSRPRLSSNSSLNSLSLASSVNHSPDGHTLLPINNLVDQIQHRTPASNFGHVNYPYNSQMNDAAVANLDAFALAERLPTDGFNQATVSGANVNTMVAQTSYARSFAPVTTKAEQITCEQWQYPSGQFSCTTPTPTNRTNMWCPFSCATSFSSPQQYSNNSVFSVSPSATEASNGYDNLMQTDSLNDLVTFDNTPSSSFINMLV